jgi:transposase-like protein
MARQRRVFTPQFKLRVVQDVLSGQSQASVARRYELSPQRVMTWKQAFETGRLGGEATGAATVQQLQAENRDLGEVVREQLMEIRFLKKALAVLRQQNDESGCVSSGKRSRSNKAAH